MHGVSATSDDGHEPVLLVEVLDALAPAPGGLYVDCTFGRGGHARGILERLGEAGRLLALDRDPAAVASGSALAAAEPRLQLRHTRFSELEAAVEQAGWTGRVDGVLFDLGVSSPQVDDPARGFSFRGGGPLDMRMDPTAGESAAQWLARAAVDEIAAVLRDYGEERHAGRIARAIERARREAPIATTDRLADLVARAVPDRRKGKTRGPYRHPATRTFQAIRVHVNAELDELRAALPQAARVLRGGGRLCVVSFHSLEDRVVKRYIRDGFRPAPPRGLPVAAAAVAPPLRAVGRATRPGDAEVARNARARSAVLRAAEKPR